MNKGNVPELKTQSASQYRLGNLIKKKPPRSKQEYHPNLSRYYFKNESKLMFLLLLLSIIDF